MGHLGKSWKYFSLLIQHASFLLSKVLFLLQHIIFHLLLEMDGLTDQKSPSWLKHAVRRWKELYYEILRVDGQIDLSNPLSVLFRNEIALLKSDAPPAKSHEQISPDTQSRPSTTESVKKEGLASPKVLPESDHLTESKRKQTKGSLIFQTKKSNAFFFNFPAFNC